MSNALISDCGKYRYWLTRHFMYMGEMRHGTVLFVMLNPSTADGECDDPTIRRCKGFASGWGYRTLVVVNLYAYRATNPAELWRADDPVGPDNDLHIQEAINQCKVDSVVCAWGANAKPHRVNKFTDLMNKLNVGMTCLGTTKHGAPKHPLYLPATSQLTDWRP